MNEQFIDVTLENIDQEHICCAISDKKHQQGVKTKKTWLKERIKEGHVFRKLNVNGKVFIEYAPLETAWVPVNGENYLYIYCLWVSGSFKGQGYAKYLLQSCIEDAKSKGKSGVCVLSSKKKTPYLSDKKFMQKFGFETIDSADDFELLALSFDGNKPYLMENAKTNHIESIDLTIYYGLQCPFIVNCIEQVKDTCQKLAIPLRLEAIDSLEKAKSVPSIFNNWAVFNHGQFQSLMLLNEGALKKMLNL